MIGLIGHLGSGAAFDEAPSCLRRKRFSAANCRRDRTMSCSTRNRSARRASAVQSTSSDLIVSNRTPSVAE